MINLVFKKFLSIRTNDLVLINRDAIEAMRIKGIICLAVFFYAITSCENYFACGNCYSVDQSESGDSSFSKRKTWIADNGNGTFTNPIFYDEFSDPDLIRVGDDYY